MNRFWSKVDKLSSPTGCWLWTATKVGGGYGGFRASTTRQVVAHRFAYELVRGSIPEGLQLDHLCRVRNCVNPDHLEAVTAKENVNRSTVIGNKSNVGHKRTRGEENARSKVTEAQVAEIRRRYAAGGISQRVLGLDYDLSQSQIGRIVNYKFWRN